MTPDDIEQAVGSPLCVYLFIMGLRSLDAHLLW